MTNELITPDRNDAREQDPRYHVVPAEEVRDFFNDLANGEKRLVLSMPQLTDPDGIAA